MSDLNFTSPTTTNILWNGSKFAGEAPDSLDTLLDLMAREPLSPGFGLPTVQGGYARFTGNFHRVSHGFCIETNDDVVIKKMLAAYRRNFKSQAFKEACDDQAYGKQVADLYRSKN